MSGDNLVCIARDVNDLPPGNWWDFPPPRPGVYNTRRVRGNTSRCDFYPNQVVTFKPAHGLYISDRTCSVRAVSVSRFPPDVGWQFQFKQAPITWKPVEVLYAPGTPTRGSRLGTRDLREVLPTAYSREEAWYIVTLLPKRWPDLSVRHIEFVEQSH